MSKGSMRELQQRVASSDQSLADRFTAHPQKPPCDQVQLNSRLRMFSKIVRPRRKWRNCSEANTFAKGAFVVLVPPRSGFPIRAYDTLSFTGPSLLPSAGIRLPGGLYEVLQRMPLIQFHSPRSILELERITRLLCPCRLWPHGAC